MKVAIAEDQEMYAQNLKMVLEANGCTVSWVASKEEEGKKSLQKEKVDLAFLDIRMDNRFSGINLAKEFQAQNIPFVFITSQSDDQTLDKAYNLSPIAYVVKPFVPQQIRAVLKQVETKLKSEKGKIVTIKTVTSTASIGVNEIVYIKVDNVYCEIFTQSEKLVVRSTLGNLLDDLQSSDLLRVGRSYAINKNHVRLIKKDEIVLNNTTIIPKPRNFKMD